MYRQAVITVRRALDEQGTYENKPSLEIPFRQPFNNLGLAFSFSFKKSFFAPFSSLDLQILNINNETTEAFSFDPATYTKMPLVEIRAGYSDTIIYSSTNINELKKTLPLIYIGYPFYYSDDKTPGGRILTLNLNDMRPAARVGRVTKEYRRGTSAIDILGDLAIELKRRSNISIDATGLTNFDGVATEVNLFFNGRMILSDILPSLAKQFNFQYSIKSNGDLKLINGPGNRPTTGAFETINTSTGMVEHPTGINFTQFQVKTFFARPKFFYPGDWVRIQSKIFQNQNKRIDALIVEGQYDFQDENAICTYVVSPEGQPVSTMPILKI